MSQSQDKLEWRGQELYDRDGDKIGKIEEIYLDADTDQPEWALVNTGLFGSKQTFIPIRDASAGEEGPRVPYDNDTVKDAPKVEADGRLSKQEEADLYRHYGVEPSEMPHAGGGAGNEGGDRGEDADADADAESDRA